MLEKYADFLHWLAVNGISPELPLILISMAAGWVLHIIFVDSRKWFKERKERKRCRKLTVKNTLKKSSKK